MKHTISLLLAASLLAAATARAETPAIPREQATQAAVAFVDAFNNLDWERFEAAWADDATLYMPMPGFPDRLAGREEIIAAFKSLFGDFPEQREGPPYLSINPIDLRVDVVGTAAIVTFLLGDESPRQRRTLVFVEQEGTWRIAHLHASRPPQ